MSAEMLRRVFSGVRSTLKLPYELEDPDSKESHPGKKLTEHVSECIELASEVSRILGIEDKFLRFLEALCSLHDIGKLHPNWRPGSKEVKHSLVGEEILSHLRGNVLGNLTGLSVEEQDLLIFMVKNHHSALRFGSKTGFKEFKKLRWLEDKPDLALGYADSFGAFKLADFASSNELGERVLEAMRMEWPSQNRLSSLISSRIDEEKLKIQRDVASSPSHVSLMAPTGWGKTMVGILSSIQANSVKLFYALPTITAIRKMVEDLRRRLFGSSSEEWLSVGEYFYFADVDIFKSQSHWDEEESRILDFYRLFIPKVNVTTVDQLLLSLLRAGKYHMRRFELRKSVVVIDEYHLLPAPMIGALAETLGFYARNYGMKIVLMTATPLSAYRNALIDALGCESHDLSSEYGKLKRHKLELINGTDEGLEVAERLLSEGKRVLVILNTVDRARDFYKKLDTKDKLLLHSRFTVKDRYEKEGKIEESEILVATQVAEVSLDVSFDALVSDLAPIPALIQRTGRVNRYGREIPEKPNVFIMRKLDSHEPYHSIEVKFSEQVLWKRRDRLASKGEEAYLEMLKEYDSLTQGYILKEINEFREKIRESIFDGNQLLAIGENEENLIRSLRGEANVLVVPSNFEREVRELFAQRREARSYEDRIRLWAEIKSYLVPIRLWTAMKFCRYIEGIPIPVVGEESEAYDPELGLLLEEL